MRSRIRLPEKCEGLWQRPASDPLIIQTHTEGDYWDSPCLPDHTDRRDGTDIELPSRTRMYHLTGAPHMGRAVDDPIWIGQLTPNSMSAAPYRRAVMRSLDRWATLAFEPPANPSPTQRKEPWSHQRRCWGDILSFPASTCPQDPAACRATTTDPTSTPREL